MTEMTDPAVVGGSSSTPNPPPSKNVPEKSRVCALMDKPMFLFWWCQVLASLEKAIKLRGERKWLWGLGGNGGADEGVRVEETNEAAIFGALCNCCSQSLRLYGRSEM
ncbi:unnamed protein product [Ilex paraguariensis]|uniref:Uncharacterized protein n=1 Tax=Ilex paraguariensis TaxID=185542 RepID=A0ABC8RET3_9AQUA